MHYSHLMHLTDPSSIKQKSLCECGFSRVNMGRYTNISDFWHILLSKKGDNVTCMPNVHSHAQFTNWKWFSMVCTLIDNDIHYHRGQNLLQTHAAQPGESAETFEHCDDEHHCLETMLNHCQFLFTTIMTSNKMILSVDASSIGKLANQIATLLLIMEKMFGKYSWHPVIKNSLISRACIYQWKLRKKI